MSYSVNQPHSMRSAHKKYRAEIPSVKIVITACLTLMVLTSTGAGAVAAQETTVAAQPDYPVTIGSFPQEMRTFYTQGDGLPSNDVLDVAVAPDGAVYAATARGLVTLRDRAAHVCKATQDQAVSSVAVVPSGHVFAVVSGALYQLAKDGGLTRTGPGSDPGDGTARVSAAGGTLMVCAGKRVDAYNVSETGDLTHLSRWDTPGVALSAAFHAGQAAIGAETALYMGRGGSSAAVFPTQGKRRWALASVRGVTFDDAGRLWAVSPQGVVCYSDTWTLYEGQDGLPYSDLTCVAAGRDGTAWFGTSIGAIRFDGREWYYRQGRRWLPDDRVRAIAVAANGDAWIATAGGLAHIHFTPMTLANKAAFYEEGIDQHHRRTEYGYVLEVSVAIPGQKTGIRQHDSDNDGLWTSMYGAGECYAYAATKDPLAKRRATQAFQALRFLQLAPVGSPHEPPAGFVARTVVATTEPDPNQRENYTLEGQIKRQAHDALWRAYEPRWPRTSDGKYYWKSDTSSDELDGHYYFYPLYYDLVAETEEEKEQVRTVVRKLTDHLIAHHYRLVDHAGVTRWGDYSPPTLNGNPLWFTERGLKSISMLAYLNVAYHMTGDEKYREHHQQLRQDHHYLQNALAGEYQRGIGSGNQSDDEMFLMCYDNLIKYEPDPELKSWYLASLANWWRLEEPEMNPFFNFTYAALARDQKITIQWGTFDVSPWPNWLEDSIETLKRFPLDRYNWAHRNSHREDIIFLSEHLADAFDDRVQRTKGYRVNGKVLAVDERHFHHWNHDPWQLDCAGDGRSLANGAVYTLAYYLGLYHGFIARDPDPMAP